MNLLVDIEAILDNGSYDEPITVNLDNPKVVHGLVLLFGNGCYKECRAVGHSKEAIFYFIRLVQRGGYNQGGSERIVGKKLYQPGDGCFPADDPFIFISPTTRDGGQINFVSLESDIQAFIVAYEKSQAPQP